MTHPALPTVIGTDDPQHEEHHEAVHDFYNTHPESPGAVGHAGSQVSVTPAGLIVVTTTNVQAALAQLDTAVANPGPPTGAASGVLTGTFPAPGLASGAVINDHVSATAGIAESKVALTRSTYATEAMRGQPYRGRIGGALCDPNPGALVTTLALTANLPFFGMLWVPTTTTVDSLSVKVGGTAGSAGAVLRLGLYNCDDDGLPTTLIVDAATVGATTANQVRTIALGTPRQLAGGRWYAGAVVSQGDPTTAPSVWASQTALGLIDQTGPGSVFVGFFNNASCTGALPATCASIFGTGSLRPLVWANIASRP